MPAGIKILFAFVAPSFIVLKLERLVRKFMEKFNIHGLHYN